MNFFSNRNIVLALVISTFTGICLMGMIFVPQWAENLLRIPTGKGGYIVTAMSVFSWVAAPMGGSLLDKYGAKRIIMMGFAFTLGGCLLMAWWVQCLWQVFIALAFVGLGIGFTMGAPLNYLILTLVSTDESGAALAVLSLFRSIGTTLGPSLMAGYLVDAGKNLMSEMKDSIPAFKMMPQATGTAAPKGIDILQTADITNIVNKLAQFLKGLDDIPSMVKPIILAQVKGNSSAIQDVYQKVMSGGFNNIYITTGVMALIGLLLTAVMTSSARAEKHVNSSSD
jgi:MFS family permease